MSEIGRFQAFVHRARRPGFRHSMDAALVAPPDEFSENGGARGAGKNMFLVVMRLAGGDIIDNHVSHSFCAVLKNPECRIQSKTFD
jgi:hypothetical protein